MMAQGRPKSDNPKDQTIALRVTADERDKWRDHAKSQHLSLSDLVREAIRQHMESTDAT